MVCGFSFGQQFYNGVPTSLPTISNPTNVTSAPFITSGTRSDTMVVTGSSLGSSYFGGTLRGQDSLHPFVVYYNNTSGAGIGIEGCKYIKIIGINATISGGGTNGYVKAKCDYVQVSGFKNLNGTNGSWWLKLESPEACNYSPVTDYLNGLASNTVITNRLMHIWFTHNQIGNTDGTNSCGGEGVYAISTGAYGRDAVPCLGGTIYKPLWGGFFHIDSNYIYNPGRTGIQLSGCDTGFNTIVGNHIFNAGRELNSTQGAGIRTGYGTNNTTYIAYNEVRNSYIYNYDLETGAIFEHNIGDSAGYWKQTKNPQGVPSVISYASLANSTVIIRHNTMGVNTASNHEKYAIYGSSNFTNDNIVCDNDAAPSILSLPFNYSTDCTDTVPVPPPTPVKTIIIKYLKSGTSYLKLKHTDSIVISRFGIFVDGSGSYNTLALQLNRAKSLKVPIFRYNYTYGNTYRLKQCKDSGLKVQLTFNYNAINSGNGYATNAVDFKNALRSTLLSITEKPDYICIRNEPSNSAYWDTASPINYVNNELIPAVELCDSLKIPVSDGGFLPGTVFNLWKYYEDNSNDSLNNWLKPILAPLGITGINNTTARNYIAWNNTVLNGMASINSSRLRVNQHGNEPWGDSSLTSTTGLFPVIMNYLSQITGKKIWTNEFHTSNHSKALLYKLLNEFVSVKPELVVYFAGDTYPSGNSIDLSNYYSEYINKIQ